MIQNFLRLANDVDVKKLDTKLEINDALGMIFGTHFLSNIKGVPDETVSLGLTLNHIRVYHFRLI